LGQLLSRSVRSIPCEQAIAGALPTGITPILKTASELQRGEKMTIGRTGVLTNIAAHIKELHDVAALSPDPELNADIYRITGLLQAVIMLITELPNAFDDTSPWWAEWTAKQALLGRTSDPRTLEG
jgi:hypothetical protein